MTRLALFVCLLALPAAAQVPAMVRVRGQLAKRPNAPVNIALAPTPGQHSTTEIDGTGKFELKAARPVSWMVQIHAEGHAPFAQTVELDKDGNADLGTVTLQPLLRAKAVATVAPRDGLAKAVAQPLVLTHGSCATVAAQDDSGCQLQFCVHQEGAELQSDRYRSGALRALGKLKLADAVTKFPKGTTVSNAYEGGVALVPGESYAGQLPDPFCAAVVHVEEVKAVK